MRNFFAIIKWNATSFRVEKSMTFDTQVLADTFVAENISSFPDAFVVVDPPGQASDLIVDPGAKTVTLSVLPIVNPSVIPFDNFESRFTTVEWGATLEFIYEVDLTTGKPKRKEMIRGLGKEIGSDRVDLLKKGPKSTDAFMTTLVNNGIISSARKTEILTL